jgi:hypothetical protein
VQRLQFVIMQVPDGVGKVFRQDVALLRTG